MKANSNQRTIIYYLKIVLRMLSKRDQFRIGMIAIVNVALSVLDLIAIACVGLLTAIAVQGIGFESQSQPVRKLLAILNLEAQSFQIQVTFLGIAAATLFIFKSLFAMYLTKKVYYLLSHKCAKVSTDISRLVLMEDLNLIQKRSTQENLFAMTSGVNSLFMGILASSVNLFSDLSMLIILVFGIFVIDPLTSMMVLVFFSLIGFILYKKLQVRARQIGEITRNLNIASSEKIIEIFATYRELLVHDRRHHYIDLIKKIRFQLADVTAESMYQPYIGKYLIEISMISGGLVFAAFQYSINDALRATTIIGIFIAASFRIAPAVLRIQQGLLGIKNNMGPSDSTIELINDLGDELEEKNSSIEEYDFSHRDFKQSIELENLEFKYDTRSDFQLTFNSYRFKPNVITAIAGPSGVGKSTLIDLILGINRPTNGKVMISGLLPLETFRMWPGAVSYVPQNTSLIKGSIRENISIGFHKNFFTDKILWEVLEKAQLKEFVQNMPGKLNADLMEIGSNLSGGQRQRLGIARALVTNPKILILDEATNALDEQTENQIITVLRQLTENITVILVAHKLATIRKADEIVYFESGSKIITGGFEEIMNYSENFIKVVKLSDNDRID
jgi:ATP-binding cassette subfamily C protein